MHVTFGAFGPDLEPLDLSAEDLLDEVVRGAQYLIDHDPRVLEWITAYQRGEAPDYPTPGTPSPPPLAEEAALLGLELGVGERAAVTQARQPLQRR
jgi:hypothetical protein